MGKTKEGTVTEITDAEIQAVLDGLQSVKELESGYTYVCAESGGGETVLQFMQEQPDASGELATVRHGIQTEQLFQVLLLRLDAVNQVVPCAENEQSIKLIQEALRLQLARRAERRARGVEGTRNP